MGSYAAYASAAYAPAAYTPAAYAPAAYASDSAALAAPIPLAALSQVLANPAAGPVARSFAAAAGAVGATAVGTAVGTGESWLAVLTVAKLAPLLGLPSSTLVLASLCIRLAMHHQSDCAATTQLSCLLISALADCD